MTEPTEITAETPAAAEPTPEVRGRWDELAQEIRRHRDLYYNGAPEIPDADFDDLFQRLLDLEAEYPALAVPDSPTQQVGAPAVATSTFDNVEHLERMMLSLIHI